MATAPQLISEEEYLHTAYRPDCDYVDGVVLERNLGTPGHSELQMVILTALQAQAEALRLRVLPECRLRVRPGKYRVPDALVLSKDAARPKRAIEVPPLLCIEVVWPEDRLKDQVERARDYVALGVPETWIFDPETELAYVYSAGGLREVPKEEDLRCGQIVLNPASLFGQLREE